MSKAIHNRILSLVLCSTLIAGVFLTGCGDSKKQEETSAALETSTGAETITETETETETETISLYNKDGSRRAWISAEGNVSVRQKPKKNGEFLGTFKPRQRITLIDEKPKKGFYHVKGKDQISGEKIEGYTAESLISLDPPPAPQVQLDVVSYLQTDKRWGKIKLGSTSMMMKDKGCATTCLAMSESFLKQTETTPKMVVENSIYTSDGNIGWPMDYYWYYTKEDALQFIFNKLHEGIPVLINQRRANGSQHWVLVTGYNGNGEELKAKDFVINDPMPKNRTNLKQFMDEFPYFKKLIFYCGDRAKVKGSEESIAAEEAKKNKKSKKNKKK